MSETLDVCTQGTSNGLKGSSRTANPPRHKSAGLRARTAHPDRVHTKFTRNLLTPLHSVFEDALNDDLIAFNPFDRTALTKLLKQTAGSSAYEVDPFTSEARTALLRAARSDKRAMVQFWLSTGSRPVELMTERATTPNRESEFTQRRVSNSGTVAGIWCDGIAQA